MSTRESAGATGSLDTAGRNPAGRRVPEPASSEAAAAARRVVWYWIVAVALVVGAWLVRGIPAPTGAVAHVGLESAAVMLSAVIGSLALVRHYSRKDATLLFIGTGFLGTAVLEFQHLAVTVPLFGWNPAGPPEDVAAWSWIASRLFLSLFLFVAWLVWWTEDRRDGLSNSFRFDEVSVYFTATVLTIVIFAFFGWVDLATAHKPGLPVSYPAELIPGLFFGLAFVGFYRKRSWATDLSEHWLVIALLVSVALHVLYAAFATEPLDASAVAAHLLKVVSYVCVLVGLMGSVYVTFRREGIAHEFSRRANEALAQEVAVRRQAEAVLQESEERLQDFLDSATDLIFMTRPDGKLIYANRAWKRTLGVGEDALRERNFLDMVLPEFRRALEDAYARALGGESVAGLEFQLRTASNQTVVVRGSMNCRFEAGRPTSVRSVLRDVTDQVRSAEELARSEANVTALVESTGDAIWSVDTSNHLITFNAAFALIAETMVGREPMVGDLPGVCLPPEDAPRFEEYYRRALRGERFSEVWTFELEGQRRAFELYFNPISEGFEITGVVVFSKDVTPRMRAEEALRAAKEEAEQANRAKTQFLANMSHELRTPLNSVIGFSNILLKRGGDRLDPKDRSFVERITANGKHLLGLINDVLDLAKVESGRLDLQMEEVDLGDLITETLEQMEGPSRDRPVELRSLIPPRLAPIETDRGKLKQVLINLVGNALKFTESGSVTVRVDTLIEHPEVAFRVAVEDTGPGIPDDRMDAIFEAFQQADGTTGRKYGGTGLGLSISRSICNLLGYEITLASELGRGSTFFIELNPRPARQGDEAEPSWPVEDSDSRAGSGSQHEPGREAQRAEGLAVASSTPPGALPEPLVRPRILVVDGNEDSRGRLLEMVEDMGCEVFTAEGGDAGLDRARALRPDLIVVAPEAPQSSTWDLLRLLGEDRRLSSIPLVLLSEDPSAPVGSFGALHVVRPPLESVDLRDSVGRALEGSGYRKRPVAMVGFDSGSRGRMEALLRAAGLSVLPGDGLDSVLSGTDPVAPPLLLVRTAGLTDRTDRETVEKLKARRGPDAQPLVEVSGAETESGPAARPALELIARVLEVLGEGRISP